MLTEISQFLLTMILVIGWMTLALLNALWHLNLDAIVGEAFGLVSAWSGFWLGAKVQRNLAPMTTTTKVGPAESTTTTGTAG